jgi:hypothetical protein
MIDAARALQQDGYSLDSIRSRIKYRVNSGNYPDYQYADGRDIGHKETKEESSLRTAKQRSKPLIIQGEYYPSLKQACLTLFPELHLASAGRKIHRLYLDTKQTDSYYIV